MYFVYIIQSLKNGSYYVGSTGDTTRRVQDHNTGKTQSTKLLRPWKLVFSQPFPTEREARLMEKKLKSYKSRVILEKIIKDGFIRAQ